MSHTKLLLSAAALLSFGVASAHAQPFQKLANPAQNFSSGHVQMCAGVAPVTVLAVEDQYGSGGGAIPTRLDYQINDNAFIPAFGGGDITAGMTTNLPMGSGGMLTLKGKISYPSFDDPQEVEAHPHTNPVNVIVLKNGDSLSDALGNKNVEAPFGEQQRIDQILAPYLNGDVITLPPGQTIQLYEFGLLTPDTEALDYQDLVLKVGYRCTHGQDVLLRNSIGPNHYTTNGNLPFNTTSAPGSTRMVPVELFNTSSSPILLTQIRGIFSFFSAVYHDFDQLDYYVHAWTDYDQVGLNPLHGNIFASEMLDTPDVGPAQFGITGYFAPGGEKPTYDLAFDLSGMGITVPAGGSIVVGIEVFSPDAPQGGGLLGVIESTESMSPSDRQYWGSGWGYVVDNGFSLHHGRVAYEVRGRQY